MTLPVLLVVLMLLDTFLSYVGIYFLGIPESNPLLIGLTPMAFLLVKLLATALVGVLLYIVYSMYMHRSSSKVRKLITYSVASVVGFYSFTVVNNIYWVITWSHVQ